MVLLLFSIGDEQYGIEAKCIVEVIPCISVKRIPKTPAYLSGIFNFRGVSVPVVDISYLCIRKHAQRYISSRIILVHYTAGSGSEHTLGLLAERVTETLKVDEDQFIPSGVDTEKKSFLGDVLMRGEQIIQRVNIDNLLPEQIQARLFQQDCVVECP
ncbi:MAG: chemotaxis protein CheW [Gammaproteobacteria bacterium]|nr:chemotaxis protein CheW [Gammaproteobacteria bacterium]